MTERVGKLIDFGGPSDISDHVARMVNATLLDDGSFMLSAAMPGDREAIANSLNLTVVHRLGVGEWIEGPITQPHGTGAWSWGGRYRPNAVAVPDDASGIE